MRQRFCPLKPQMQKSAGRTTLPGAPFMRLPVLFVGIFITMQPALMILKANGASLGLNKPFEMFWATGFLSSFLDNTPTYLVFLTTAGALGFTEACRRFSERFRLPCWRLSHAARYLWERTLTSAMRRTLWSNPFPTRMVSGCLHFSATCSGLSYF